MTDLSPRAHALRCLALKEEVEAAKASLRDREAALRQAEIAMADALPDVVRPLARRVNGDPGGHRLMTSGETLHETLLDLGDGTALVQFRCDKGNSAIRANVRRIPSL